MSIHWKSLDRAGRIEAIKEIWEPGMSSREIAAHFHGVTRNAIIGLFTRWSDEFGGCQLPYAPKSKGPGSTKERRVRIRARAPKAPKPVVYRDMGETHGVGRPIVDLGASQCRWPVNDATPQQEHLFCGLPSRGSYCDHHAARAVRLDRGEG